MIDDTVKELLRAARDAKTLEDCKAVEERANCELTKYATTWRAVVVVVGAREREIVDQYKFDIANEAP
jgi:RNA polymerase subunit RPABC4/transcription elongation factor Spt4